MNVNGSTDSNRLNKLYFLKVVDTKGDCHESIPITIDEFSRLSIPRASEILKNKPNETIIVNESKPVKKFITPFVVPCRTDAIGSFVRDLTLPAFFNVTFKVNNLKEKIFLSSLAVSVDIITLPLRLMTAIPRIFWNLLKRKEQHPLYKFLRDNGCDKSYLDKNNLYKLMLCRIKRDFDPSLTRPVNKIQAHLIWFAVAPVPFFLNYTQIDRIEGNLSESDVSNDQVKRCYRHKFKHLSDEDFKRDLQDEDEVLRLKIKNYLLKPAYIDLINSLMRYIPDLIDSRQAQSMSGDQMLPYCGRLWKKFAIKFHPDKNPEDGGEAFQTLSPKYETFMKFARH
jgi:hypothetical protein